jgi:hypothetical protein
MQNSTRPLVRLLVLMQACAVGGGCRAAPKPALLHTLWNPGNVCRVVSNAATESMLHELDNSIRAIAGKTPDQANKLFHIYHNLLRMWADA